ncbi:Predicted hydrolase (HAD superfamily) [Phaffia rhodozyma]|uniref:Predicted hydrolase (HAD superfamily) n=1 Tax=Phaffia rhodozyma TaxID=264483 RepID=A0A0F7SRZ9_PHARH|nr:Predicted hydrolase (HAD superfamily) [Phaffia rhodozyma]
MNSFSLRYRTGFCSQKCIELMVQVPVIARLFGLLGRPKSFLPHLKVEDIRQINFQSLRDLGYKGVVFDKDNCLTKPYVDTVEPHLKDSLASSIRAFGLGNVLMVSNSSGTRNDPGHLGAEALYRATQAPVLLHGWKKPGCYNEVWTYFYRRQELLSQNVFPEPDVSSTAVTAPTTLVIPPSSETPGSPGLGLVVIGDRLLTDTLLTSLIRPPPITASAYTTAVPNTRASLPVNLSILTTQLHTPKDVRLLRVLERLIERIIRRIYIRSVPAVDVTDEQWRLAGVLTDGKGSLAPQVFSTRQQMMKKSKIQMIGKIAGSIGSVTRQIWRGGVSGWMIIRQEGLAGLATRAQSSLMGMIDRSREKFTTGVRNRLDSVKCGVSEWLRTSLVGRLGASVVSMVSSTKALVSSLSSRVGPGRKPSKSRID